MNTKCAHSRGSMFNVPTDCIVDRTKFIPFVYDIKEPVADSLLHSEECVHTFIISSSVLFLFLAAFFYYFTLYSVFFYSFCFLLPIFEP
jgi:hypothetical protein